MLPAGSDTQREQTCWPHATRWCGKPSECSSSGGGADGCRLTDPEAGRPLLGELIGWRKLTVGNRDWRVVWRVTNDDGGIDVAEAWAAGACSDGEVYAEMSQRVLTLPDSPRTTALATS